MQIKVIRKTEAIEVAGTDLRWEVPTDDRSLEEMHARLANAIERASDLQAAVEGAKPGGDAEKALQMVVDMQKRAICSVIGAEGYNELLAYIGDGDPVDHGEYVMVVGDVMAALCVFVLRLYEQMIGSQAYIDEQRASASRGKRRKKGGK